jgi:hypothetical protein
MSKPLKVALYLLIPFLLALAGLALVGGGLGLIGAALAASGWLLVPVMVVAARRMSGRAWLAAGLLMLAGLALPYEITIMPEGALGWYPWFVPALAIVAASMVFLAGLRRRDGGKGSNRTAAACLILGALIAARALQFQYWLLVWDSTYDPLMFIWMGLPLVAAAFSGLALIAVWPGRRIWGGLSALLIPALLVGVYVLAQRVDFRQLTAHRAERAGQAIEAFYAREGRYPQSLAEARPWYAARLAGPVIMAGQDWCYQADESDYQLGYVYREHWSDPRLVGMLAAQGVESGDPGTVCEAEIAALRAKYPGYYTEGGN